MGTIYIDGEAREANEKQNLLHACLSLGLDLPYFCWHPASARAPAVTSAKDAVLKSPCSRAPPLMPGACDDGVHLFHAVLGRQARAITVGISFQYRKLRRRIFVVEFLANQPRGNLDASAKLRCARLLAQIQIGIGHRYRC